MLCLLWTLHLLLGLRIGYLGEEVAVAVAAVAVAEEVAVVVVLDVVPGMDQGMAQVGVKGMVEDH